MAHIDENIILQYAELNVECMAMNDAALAEDFDEARFRAHRMFGQALALGLRSAADAAGEVARLLGEPGTEPAAGYGHAMLRLAKVLTPS